MKSAGRSRKPFNTRLLPSAYCGWWHPGVLPADRSRVGRILGWRTAQNAQVNVADQRGVTVQSICAVLGGHDEIRDHGRIRGDPQKFRGHVRTPLFVVSRPRVVNDVVKPDGDLDGDRVGGEHDVFIKQVQAVGDVPQVVVGPALFAISGGNGGPSGAAVEPGVLAELVPAVGKHAV